VADPWDSVLGLHYRHVRGSGHHRVLDLAAEFFLGGVVSGHAPGQAGGMIAWLLGVLTFLFIVGGVLLTFVFFESYSSAIVKCYWIMVLVSLMVMMTFGAFFGIIHPMLIPVPGIVTFVYLYRNQQWETQ
jgi:hypothetical protein